VPSLIHPPKETENARDADFWPLRGDPLCANDAGATGGVSIGERGPRPSRRTSKIWVHNAKRAKAAAPLGAHFRPGGYSLSEREREIAVGATAPPLARSRLRGYCSVPARCCQFLGLPRSHMSRRILLLPPSTQARRSFAAWLRYSVRRSATLWVFDRKDGDRGRAGPRREEVYCRPSLLLLPRTEAAVFPSEPPPRADRRSRLERPRRGWQVALKRAQLSRTLRDR
jgi:hypothetical protein